MEQIPPLQGEKKGVKSKCNIRLSGNNIMLHVQKRFYKIILIFGTLTSSLYTWKRVINFWSVPVLTMDLFRVAFDGHHV